MGKGAQQHHHSQDDVHDADPFVVDARDPVAPQRAPRAEIGYRGEYGCSAQSDCHKRPQKYGFVEWNGVPRETACQVAGQFGHGVTHWLRMASYSPGATSE